MEMCYKILGEGKLVTQRELFYKLLSDSPKYFSCQRHVNQTIQGLQILHSVLVSSCNISVVLYSDFHFVLVQMLFHCSVAQGRA